MNELEEAFDEALDAAEDTKGEREKVTFRGADIDALFGSGWDDLSPVGGGIADMDPLVISVRTRDITAPIEPLEPITVRGQEMAILKPKFLEGRIDLECGDPSTEMN